MEVVKVDLERDGALATGRVGDVAFRAELRVVNGELGITDLRLIADGGFLPDTTGHAFVTSPVLRSLSFEDIQRAVRDEIEGRLPTPLDRDDETRALARAAERLAPEWWREARSGRTRPAVQDRTRRGRRTNEVMLRRLAQRYVELDHDERRPPIIRTLAEEASERPGRQVPEATIKSRISRAERLGLIEGRQRGRRGGSRLGPNFYAPSDRDERQEQAAAESRKPVDPERKP